MSPFGRESVLPRFLTDRARWRGRRCRSSTVRQQARPADTWYRDWASRVLRHRPQGRGHQRSLPRGGARASRTRGCWFGTTSRSRDTAWGLDPARLVRHRSVGQVHVLAVPAAGHAARGEVPSAGWAAPARSTAATGTLRARRRSQADLLRPHLPLRRLERIFATEHTGLLSREEREQIEEEFKEGNEPGRAESVRVHADAGDGHRHRRPVGRDALLGAADHGQLPAADRPRRPQDRQRLLPDARPTAARTISTSTPSRWR